jgi:hypothetical protein
MDDKDESVSSNNDKLVDQGGPLVTWRGHSTCVQTHLRGLPRRFSVTRAQIQNAPKLFSRAEYASNGTSGLNGELSWVEFDQLRPLQANHVSQKRCAND